jgi:hypothetical protein
MVELAFILYGAEVARRRLWLIGLVGLSWFALGLFFFVNAFLDEVRINPIYFTVPLLIDATLSVVAGFTAVGTGRRLRWVKAALFFFLAALIYGTHGHAEMLVGLTVGVCLCADAIWRASVAYVVRFRGWRRATLFAVVEFGLGLWSISPWPTRWQGEVGHDVGLLLMFSAAGICALAWRLLWLPPGAPMSRAVAAGIARHGNSVLMVKSLEQEPVSIGPRITARVHVWTPTGALASVDRAVSRYVAARDANGTISTGHAAMEAADIYVSHYPAVDIDRSPEDFQRTLRATEENDVAGRFLPGYAEEAAAWCESTMKVDIPGIDAGALRRFWVRYSADTTYNLTSRNCSSSVAVALDAGMEGVFKAHAGNVYFFLRLLFSPELWIAAQLRHRAETMAWTPGILLDYARAMAYVIKLPGRLGVAVAEDARLETAKVS